MGESSVTKNIPKSNVIARRKPLWMNKEALAKVKQKHHAWKRYQQTRDGLDYTEYIRARNDAKKAARKAVKTFERKLANNIKADPKSFWQYAKRKTTTKSRI